jgi:hypothetical protein
MALTPGEKHHNDHRAEQLSLLSPKELESLRSWAPAAARTPSSQTDKVRKPLRSKADSIQDEFPFRR